MTRRVVLAETEQGAPVVIGAVTRDESVDAIRDAVTALGWENLGVARYMTVAELRQFVQDGEQ